MMSENTETTQEIDEHELYRLMVQANDYAQAHSKHKNNAVGCVFKLADDSEIVSANEWLDFLDPTRDIKIKIGGSSPSKHAEPTGLAKAAQEGKSTKGAALIITDPLCPNCMNAVISAGITDIYILDDGFERDWYKRRSPHFDETSLQMAANAGVKVSRVKMDHQNKAAKSGPIDLPEPTQDVHFIQKNDALAAPQNKPLSVSFNGAPPHEEERAEKQNKPTLLQRKHVFWQSMGNTIIGALGWHNQQAEKNSGDDFSVARISSDEFDLSALKKAIKNCVNSRRNEMIAENGNDALSVLVIPPQKDENHYTIMMTTSISTIEKAKKKGALEKNKKFQKMSADKREKELKKYQALIYPVDMMRSLLAYQGTRVPPGSQLITSKVPTSHEQVGLHDIMGNIQLHILDPRKCWMSKDKSALEEFDKRDVSLCKPPHKRLTNDLTVSSACAVDDPHPDVNGYHCDCC